MEQPLVVEVAMEVAFPKDFLGYLSKKYGPDLTRYCAMSTSVGGIGPLLKERLIEQGNQGINVFGVSLLYETVWAQIWHEWGQISLQKRDVAKVLKQELIRTDLGFEISFFDGEKKNVEVWKLDYGKAVMYFLSAPGVTDIVYPGPKDMPAKASDNPHLWSHVCRLKQSWLVGRGALHVAKKLGQKPSIIVMSETPTIFTHHHLVQDDFQNDPFFSNTKYIFNDHTPLEYAHPIWDYHTITQVKVDRTLFENKPAWNPHKKTLDITSLLVGVCDGVFGVAKKHAAVMKAMPSLKEFSEKIEYVTNGVSKADWQAPEFEKLDQLTDQQLLLIKREKKKKMLDWAWRHCNLWPTWAKEVEDKNIIAWTRRITPYKRLDLLVKMLKNPDLRKRFLAADTVVLAGGRIHQQDNHAQDIVYDLLDVLEKNPDLQSRIVTLDNFNIWEAPVLYQGVDGAIMLADDTREASATGFMKAQMNGAAILATSDGAVPEFVYFDGPEENPEQVNGFFIPYINGEPTAQGLLEAIEKFHQRTRSEADAAKLIRAAIKVTKDVDVARTVREMNELYQRVLKPV